MTTATLMKGNIYLGLARTQRFGPFSSWQETGSMQAKMALDKELRVLHLDPQEAEGDCVPHWV